jgi:hypothetical protein
VKITAVTPVAAAASPSHPDHARWVKEQTLKAEIKHAQSLGLSLRHAETENTRQLERLAQRKKKPKKVKAPPRKDWTAEQLAKEGVTVRAAPKRKAPQMPPCKLCRQCVWCKRAIRVSHIGMRARRDDHRARALQDELNAIMLAAITRKDYRDALARELPFSRITGHDVDKAVTMGIEWVCDRSVSFMGQWR